MNIDLMKRNLARELKSKHDHPGNPEKDDVKTGDEDTGGIKGIQVVGGFRPTQGRKGP